MANQQFANNATTTVGPPLTITGTSLTVNTGDGALFPSISGSQYFYLTLTDSTNNIEIVKCTARSFDTFTIVRAQDGTTPSAWATGSLVELRLVRANLNQFYQLGSDLGTPSAGNLTNCTNLQIPSGIVGTLPIVNGGTGATTASAARTNLGLAINVNVLGYVAPGASGNLLTSNGTAWTSAAPPNNGFGVGQTWVEYDGSTRAYGTVYTNSTSKPIMVTHGYGRNTSANVYVNGTSIATLTHDNNNNSCQFYTFVVPSGLTYEIAGSYSGDAVSGNSYWNELR